MGGVREVLGGVTGLGVKRGRRGGDGGGHVALGVDGKGILLGLVHGFIARSTVGVSSLRPDMAVVNDTSRTPQTVAGLPLLSPLDPAL